MSPFSCVILQVSGTNATTPFYLQLIDLLTSDPKVALSFLIQLFLGMTLGYYMARVFKYVLAFIAVLVIGVVLNVWSLGGSLEDALLKLGEQALTLKDVAMNFISMLGLLTIGPVTLGFLIGLVIAWRK